MINNWLALLLLLAVFGILLIISLKLKNETHKFYYKFFLILIALVFVKNLIALFSAGFLQFFSNQTNLSYLITAILGDIVNIAIIVVIVYISIYIAKKVLNKDEK